MQTMHPTLLIGPADWDPTLFPRAEFERRIAAVWEDHPDAGGAIVYGNARDHSALAYLTHFTPKLEAALGLIPRNGAWKLLVGGGVNMIAAARPLTFVEDLGPLRAAAVSTTEWTRGLDRPGIVLIGGDAMPYDMRRALDAALAPVAMVENGDEGLKRRMRKKTRHELAALQGACTTLSAGIDTLRASFDSGRGITDCVLAAEGAALQRGAQDVRSLFGHDRRIGLWPFTTPIPQHVDPLQVYLAVRHAGYWAEAFVTLSRTQNALQEAACEAVEAMIAATRPGVLPVDLWKIMQKYRGTFATDALTQDVAGSAVGLTLDEWPLLASDHETALAPGEAYSLRAGFRDQTGAGAIASAMVIVTETGHSRLWPTNMCGVP
jgi:Metallopeptidase family M24